jgi:hypothetical protein
LYSFSYVFGGIPTCIPTPVVEFRKVCSDH